MRWALTYNKSSGWSREHGQRLAQYSCSNNTQRLPVGLTVHFGRFLSKHSLKSEKVKRLAMQSNSIALALVSLALWPNHFDGRPCPAMQDIEQAGLVFSRRSSCLSAGEYFSINAWCFVSFAIATRA